MDLYSMCKCKKCGYRFAVFVGVGMLYPKVYCENVKKMKSGRFGAQGKEFFEAFPNGAILREDIVVQCNNCGKLMNVQDLTLYVPKEGFESTKLDEKIP